MSGKWKSHQKLRVASMIATYKHQQITEIEIE